jgi:O-antigen ligase
VTVTAIPALADGRPTDDAPPRDRLAIAAHVSVAVALVWWAFGLTHATGGRDPWALTIGMPLAVVALVAVRPWRVMTTRSLALAAAVAVAPVLVCLVDPTGWFGASQAATYAYAAALFVTVRGYAVTPGRRRVVIGVVLASAVAQFAWATIAWVGGGDPAGVMVGTFYWHNQYAAFLLVPAVVGAGLAVAGTGPLRLLGGLAAVLGSAGIVLSTSRATMSLLVVGWLVAAVVPIAAAPGTRRRAAAACRWVGVAAVAVVTTRGLPGPPLFSHRVSALAATAVRGSGQSVTQNGDYRLRFWHQSVKVFAQHPWTGAGFGSFGRQAGAVDAAGPHSALVHSGLLQPLSDGGLLLACPFLLACVAVAVALLRRLLPSAWRADGGAVTLLSAGCLLLGAHSAVDFDWTYPSLMAAAAILAATALAWSPAGPGTPESPSGRSGVARVNCLVLVLVLVVACIILAVASRHGGWNLTARAHVVSSAFGEPAR